MSYSSKSIIKLLSIINPLVPDAHYSERQDKPFSLQIRKLEVRFKVKLQIFIFCTLGINGLIQIANQS